MINYYYSGGNGPERRFGHSNPIANALVVLAGVLAIAVLLVVGFFAFLAIAAVVAVAALVVAIRLWWLGRGRSSQPRQPSPGDSTVIEGELLESTESPSESQSETQRR